MKITALETIYLPDYPSILFVAVHTDAGLRRLRGYLLHARRGRGVHPSVRRTDACRSRSSWRSNSTGRRLYEVIAHTVGKGAELRGLSAIDVCLWDILGQAAGMPVWQVLGGAVRDRIRT